MEETPIAQDSEHDVGKADLYNTAAAGHTHHHAASTKKENPIEKIMHYKKHILVTLFYLVVALLMFYQITSHISTVAPGTGADTYQNLWDIWWVNYAVFNLHTTVFYTKLLFWPLGAGLAFQTLAPLLGLVSAPIQALFGTVFAYNVMFFAGFAFSGLCMFILADYLTKNNYAAAIAGFIFAFSAFHIAQSYSHIHFMNIEFVPLFVYFLLKVINNENRKGLDYLSIIGMSASFALTTLAGNIEQTVMLFLALVLIIIMYLFYSEYRNRIITKRFVISFVVFIVLALVIGAWNFIPLAKAALQPGGLGTANFLNSVQSNIQWSTTIPALFVPSYFNGLIYHSGIPASIYSIYAADPVERVAYIGFAVIALMLYGIYKYKKEILPWAVGAIIFTWLALGPNLGLYLVYHAIPAVNIVREPGRFQLISTMFIAILAAYGGKALFEHLGKKHTHSASSNNGYKALIVLAIIFIIMFVENNGIPSHANNPTTSISVPKLYYEIGNLTSNFSVLELPALPTSANNTYLYPGEETFYTSITKKPLVGGYLGRTQNVSSELLLYNIPLVLQSASLITNGTPIYMSPINENFTNQTLLALYNYETDLIVVHYPAFGKSQLSSLLGYLTNTFGNPIYSDNSSAVFATLEAVNRSVFKSFVSYPVVTDWEQANLLLNGSYQTYWVPVSAGSVIVYAPYSSAANQITETSQFQYVNTTVRFYALSNSPQILYVDEPTSNGTRTIANIEVTSTPALYTFNVPMISGPIGNPLFFLYKYNTSPIFMQNISFSRQLK